MATTLNFSGIGPDTIVIEENGDPADGVVLVRSVNGLFGTFALILPADSLSLVFGANQRLVMDFDESMGAANLTVGSLTNAAINPVNITVDYIETTGAVVMAAIGTINEVGADAGIDITAASLALSAGGGVGTVSILETEVSTLEAETNTGGIRIANIGNIVVGGLTADISGLSVTSSGHISLTNLGSITLSDTDGLSTIQGGTASSNVTLVASGVGASISSSVDQDAISAPGGNIVLTAGDNVIFGAALNYDNDVRARGSVTINAGGYFYIDGFADLASDDYGANTGGGVTINAAEGIYIYDTYGTDASITASGSAGADVILNSAPFVTIQAGSTGAVGSNSGDVTITSDEVIIAADSGITASSGTVTLRPSTGGLRMNLSLNDVANAFDLSDAELDRIFTSNLIVGSSTAGALTISSDISITTIANLTLLSGDNITLRANVFTTDGNLTLKSGRNLSLLTGSTLTVAGTLNGFVDTPSTDTTGGILSLLGALTAGGLTFTGAGDADRLTGSANGETLIGNSGNDTLLGLGGNDFLYGGNGNDTLDGGLGSDTLDGGVGVDIATYASAGSAVTVSLSIVGAQDTIGAGVDSLTAIEHLTGSAFDDTLTGSATDNTIRGEAGNDIITGGGGADKMYGGLGNDTFNVDSSTDQVFEVAGQGTDLVIATVTYALSAEVENLTLGGVAAINGTGNTLDNLIVGNAAANHLKGLGGVDTLQGGAGNDILEGGTGADSMTGGSGDDTFIVDNVGDLVIESSGGGTDLVLSSVTYTLLNNSVENLTLTGNAAINGTGNTIANVITGNSVANVLAGKGGADTLHGGGGADTFLYTAPGDTPFATPDVIDDYTAADKLDLALIDADSTLGGNQTFSRVVGDGAFTAAAQLRLVFDGTYTHVEFNTDADADAEMAILLFGDHTAATAEDGWIL